MSPYRARTTSAARGRAAELLDRVKARARPVAKRHKGRIPVEPGLTLEVVHRGPPGRLRHAKIIGSSAGD